MNAFTSTLLLTVAQATKLHANSKANTQFFGDLDAAFADLNNQLQALGTSSEWNSTWQDATATFGTCDDSWYTAADNYGDDCGDYANFPSWCGNYDTNTFVSANCCACQDPSEIFESTIAPETTEPEDEPEELPVSTEWDTPLSLRFLNDTDEPV